MSVGAAPGRHPYAVLASTPGWRRLLLASRLAMLTISMGPIGYVLAGREATGSFAAGGLLAGVNAFGQGVGAPWQGRRLDRRDTREALITTMGLVGVALALLAIAVGAKAPLVVLLALAFASGVAVSGVPGGYRALLPGMVADADVEMALTVDAALVEIVWITGPPLAGLIVFLDSATAAVAAMAVLAIVAAAMTITVPRREGSGRRWHQGRISLLKNRRALPIYAVGFGMGFGFGGIDFGFPPLVKALGASPAAGGFFLALLAGSSGVVALIYAARRPTATTARRVGLVLGAWAVLLGAFSVAPNVWVGVLLTPLAGMPIALLNSQVSLLLRARLPADRQAEAFSIVWSAMTIGTGIGSTVGAAIIGPLGARGVFVVLPAITLVLGAIVAATAGS